MSYSYRLKSHTDIGYDKFFDTFREEYEVLWHSGDEKVILDFINKKLSKYNARVDRKLNDGTLIFDSDADFTWFVLRWS